MSDPGFNIFIRLMPGRDHAYFFFSQIVEPDENWAYLISRYVCPAIGFIKIVVAIMNFC